MVNSVKAPGWVYLISLQHHNAILFYRFDIRIFRQTLECRCVKYCCKTIDCICIHRQNLRTRCGFGRCKSTRSHIVFQRHDVLISNWHTHQVGKIRAKRTARFVDTQCAVEFNKQNVFVIAQAHHVSVFKFNNKAIDSRRIHITDRITQACFFGNFAIQIDAIFEQHDVVACWRNGQGWSWFDRRKHQWCKQRNDHQGPNTALSHHSCHAHTSQYRLNP